MVETPRRGGNQPFTTHVGILGFPDEFATRPEADGPDFAEAVTWLVESRPRKQNHWPTLALALIAQAEALLGTVGTDAVADVFTAYPPEVATPGGRAVNTLNFTLPDGGTVKLRPLYNEALWVVRNVMLRNHPSNPGHATQSWTAYRPLIEVVHRMTAGERRVLAEWVWVNGVLPLPEIQLAHVRERVVRPFEVVLAAMPTSVRNVRGGAMLQALVYGYFRADSPNLILEAHSVNTGSSRAGMLGDVDGFRGSEPELAAEVKDLDLDAGNAEIVLGDFLEDIATAPNATAVVVCRSVTDEARVLVERRNVRVLTVPDLVRTVSVWDLPKQQEALRGVDYFLGRIQKDTRALRFFRDWLDRNHLDAGLSADLSVPVTPGP